MGELSEGDDWPAVVTCAKCTAVLISGVVRGEGPGDIGPWPHEAYQMPHRLLALAYVWCTLISLRLR